MPQNKVREFHIATKQPINDTLTLPSDEILNLRHKLIQEEVDELKEAIDSNDIVEIADALGDILYHLYAFGVMTGISLNEVFDEIHKSNMTKITPDGQVLLREDGKIIKPCSYIPPDINSILMKK